MVRDTDFQSQNIICVVTKVSDETATFYFRADMETAAPFKTLVTTYQTACYQNPVEKTLTFPLPQKTRTSSYTTQSLSSNPILAKYSLLTC